jgi:hypothetical protein
MLTLDRPEASASAPIRLIRPSETALWAPGVEATFIGWGAYFFGDNGYHPVLREAHGPIRTDADCAGAYGSGFHAASMFCVGAADPPGSSDTCQGDSGGPLLVEDGSPYALAGVVSTGFECNREGFPGIYARIGAPALNAWVRSRLYSLNFTNAPATPTAGQPATFTATAAAGTTDVRWDFDGNGTTDASGSPVSHTYPSGGARNVVLKATDPEGQPAERRRLITVANATGTTVTPTVTPSPTPAPTVPPPVVLTPRLGILVIGRTAVVDRLGRFGIRINFSEAAPAGKSAVVTVRKGASRLGTAKVKVARGKSVRAKVKLTKSGLKRLKKAKKLKVTVRFVLGTTVQTKTVTLKSR